MLIQDSYIDLPSSHSINNKLRIHLYKPNSSLKFPCILFFSEIYQVTKPIARLCRLLSSYGYIVIAPEIYSEYLIEGTMLDYGEQGTARGNELKIRKPLCNYDKDIETCISYIKTRSDWNGKIGSTGICLGGHLAYRASLYEDISATVTFFATDIAKNSLGYGKNDDSLKRANEIKGELMMIWGKQDPHTPREDIEKIHKTLLDNNVDIQWCIFNANHAFVRDENSKGRYDPSITRLGIDILLSIFNRRLQLGCESGKDYKANDKVINLNSKL